MRLSFIKWWDAQYISQYILQYREMYCSKLLYNNLGQYEASCLFLCCFLFACVFCFMSCFLCHVLCLVLFLSVVIKLPLYCVCVVLSYLCCVQGVLLYIYFFVFCMIAGVILRAPMTTHQRRIREWIKSCVNSN